MTILHDSLFVQNWDESILINDFLDEHTRQPVQRLDSWREPKAATPRKAILVVNVVRCVEREHPGVTAIKDLRRWTRQSIRAITDLVGLHEQSYHYWKRHPEAAIRRDGAQALLRLHATAKVLNEVAGSDEVFNWWQNYSHSNDALTLLEDTGLALVRRHLELGDEIAPEFTEEDWDSAMTPNVDWESAQMARDRGLPLLAAEDGAEET